MMNKDKIAFFHFHDSLNDFLPLKKSGKKIEVAFAQKSSIKDVIESLGVPHPEIDLVIANGISVDFSYGLQENDYVEVFPSNNLLKSSSLIHLQPVLAPPLRFILDVHLGKLTRFLRMMGFDSLYRNDFSDPEIVSIASVEQRIILTRDLGILKYSLVKKGYWIRSTDPPVQLREVVHRYGLCAAAKPFTICMHCNEPLVNVSKNEILSELEPNTARYYNSFKKCFRCKNIYWAGSHMEKMKSVIKLVCPDIETGE